MAGAPASPLFRLRLSEASLSRKAKELFRQAQSKERSVDVVPAFAGMTSASPYRTLV